MQVSDARQYSSAPNDLLYSGTRLGYINFSTRNLLRVMFGKSTVPLIFPPLNIKIQLVPVDRLRLLGCIFGVILERRGGGGAQTGIEN